MIKDININEQPCTLKVILFSPEKEKVWIAVSDKDNPLTYYSHRYCNFKGEKEFHIDLPQTSENIRLIVFKEGENPKSDDSSIEILRLSIGELRHRMLPMSRKLRSFVKFAQEFSESASYLPASPQGEAFRSDNGKFRIVYFDKLRNRNTGKVVSTPARISRRDGTIQISKDDFKNNSVSQRMAILLHEFSHFYLNENPASELEADKYAMKIYTSLGYPRIDFHNAFLNVFKKSTTDQNYYRYKSLNKLMGKWDLATKKQ